MKKIYVISPHQEMRSDFIKNNFRNVVKYNSVESVGEIMIPPPDCAHAYVLLKRSDIQWWNFYTENSAPYISIVTLESDESQHIPE